MALLLAFSFVQGRGWLFLALAVLVCAGNWYGVIAARVGRKRRKHGVYTHVPFLSLLFSLLAWGVARETFGLWAFLPAALDPGTWLILALPYVFIQTIRKHAGRATRRRETCSESRLGSVLMDLG